MTAAVPEPPHLVTDLKTLCLATMTAEWRPLAAQATRERQPPAEYLAQLVHLEVTGRRERRIQRRLQEARFPMLKTLDAFQFDAQPELDRDAILQLCGGAFVAEAANVVLVGGVGTGKTHLAIALGMACCQHDYRVRFLDGRRVDHAARRSAAAGAAGLGNSTSSPASTWSSSTSSAIRAVRQGRRRPPVRLHRAAATSAWSLVVKANLPFARWSEVVPGCDRRRGRHRPHRAPRHRADDQHDAIASRPPNGTRRPTLDRRKRVDGHPSRRGRTERNDGRPRRDDHPTEGSPVHVAAVPFRLGHFQRRSGHAVRVRLGARRLDARTPGAVPRGRQCGATRPQPPHVSARPPRRGAGRPPVRAAGCASDRSIAPATPTGPVGELISPHRVSRIGCRRHRGRPELEGAPRLDRARVPARSTCWRCWNADPPPSSTRGRFPSMWPISVTLADPRQSDTPGPQWPRTPSCSGTPNRPWTTRAQARSRNAHVRMLRLRKPARPAVEAAVAAALARNSPRLETVRRAVAPAGAWPATQPGRPSGRIWPGSRSPPRRWPPMTS